MSSNLFQFAYGLLSIPLNDYGVAIAEDPLAGLAARAAVVLDEDDKVIDSELVREIADEPDYATALKALS